MIRFSALRQAVVVAAALSLATSALAASGPEDVFPPGGDPIMGDYVGRWSDDVEVDPELAAMVIPLGNDKYRLRFVAMLDMRCPPKAIIEAEANDGAIEFDGQGFHGVLKGDTISGRGGKSTFTLKKTVLNSPTLGARPPQGAVVLFDGTGFGQWESSKGWELADDGAMMVTPAGGYLVSKDTYKDVTLHVEFRLPYMPRARGQQRGNSGVFLQDVYEVQVLDSYGLEGYYDDCGGLYKLAAPRVNACRPPLQWQTYDIVYRAPRYTDAGVLAENGRVSVKHNGVLIHDSQALMWVTAWTEEERLGPAPSEPGHIRLQAHNNYVQFRNIWLVEN